VDIEDTDVYNIRPCRNCTVCNVFKELEPPVAVVMVVCDIEAMARGCVDVIGCVDERNDGCYGCVTEVVLRVWWKISI
jgi:hypothetical protein